MSKVAIVLGSTGVVGSALIKQLLNDDSYGSVISFSRRKLDIENTKLTQHIVNFDTPLEWQEKVRGDDVFCCIGTTLKQAKSKSRQQEIDLELPLAFAKTAKQHVIKQFILVSSAGANKTSKSFYLRLKGQLEESIMALRFSRFVIVRPSVLIGQRNEFRLGEKLSIAILSTFQWLPFIKRFRPITGEQVAISMRKLANANDNKTLVVKELDQLFL